MALLLTVVPVHGRPVAAVGAALKPPQQNAILIFGGDMMFDRWIRKVTENHDDSYVLSCINPVLQKADAVIANLEGPITSNSSKSRDTKMGNPDNMTFTFATSTASILFNHNIRIVNLGNNHIENFGTAGVRSTIEALKAANVEYFGDPIDSTVVRKEINQVRFAFINYNEFVRPAHGGTSASTTVEQILAAKNDGYLPIVYTHWGIEYATTSLARVQRLGHQFIDAGAEMVIGSHPHVVQDHELYHGKNIYYSLGNLVFDQYFHDTVQRGLVLKILFDPHGVQRIKEIPVNTLKSGITCPDDTPPANGSIDLRS